MNTEGIMNNQLPNLNHSHYLLSQNNNNNNYCKETKCLISHSIRKL